MKNILKKVGKGCFYALAPIMIGGGVWGMVYSSSKINEYNPQKNELMTKYRSTAQFQAYRNEREDFYDKGLALEVFSEEEYKSYVQDLNSDGYAKHVMIKNNDKEYLNQLETIDESINKYKENKQAFTALTVGGGMVGMSAFSIGCLFKEKKKEEIEKE